MIRHKGTVFLTITISFILFLVCFITYGNIYDFMLPKVENVSYQTTELNQLFLQSLVFSVSIATIPVLLLLIWRFSPITSKNKKIASIATVIFCILATALIRVQIIKNYLKMLVSNVNSLNDKALVSYPINRVYFEYYIILGICIGCVVSHFLFRQNDIKNPVK